jgi:hypothetical protein
MAGYKGMKDKAAPEKLQGKWQMVRYMMSFMV